MNQDRTCCTSTNRPLQFTIRSSDFALDERLPYIESVCAVLIESRFGPHQVEPWILYWNCQPELDPEHQYDLFDEVQTAPMPLSALRPQGRARVGTTCGSGWLGLDVHTARSPQGRADQCGKLLKLKREKVTRSSPTTFSHFHLSPFFTLANQGRGSPRFSGTPLHRVSGAINVAVGLNPRTSGRIRPRRVSDV